MAKIPRNKYPDLVKIVEKQRNEAGDSAERAKAAVAKLKALKAASLKLKKELAGEDD